MNRHPLTLRGSNRLRTKLAELRAFSMVSDKESSKHCRPRSMIRGGIFWAAWYSIPKHVSELDLWYLPLRPNPLKRLDFSNKVTSKLVIVRSSNKTNVDHRTAPGPVATRCLMFDNYYLFEGMKVIQVKSLTHKPSSVEGYKSDILKWQVCESVPMPISLKLSHTYSGEIRVENCIFFGIDANTSVTLVEL